MSTIAAPVPVASSSRLSLLDAEPELATWIAPSQRPEAAVATRVPEVVLERGPFDPDAVYRLGRDAFGAIIVSGLIAREICLDDRPALRLLGPGDVFVDEQPGSNGFETAGAWTVSVATHLAVLDDHLLVAVRRWPRLMRGLCSRLQQSHDATLLQLSISHRPAVEDRIVGLFGVLAARWGRVTPEGLVVPIPLTHDAIGQMIGARRPTVTLGLRALALQGRLDRDAEGRWLLAPVSDGLQSPRRHERLTLVAG